MTSTGDSWTGSWEVTLHIVNSKWWTHLNVLTFLHSAPLMYRTDLIRALSAVWSTGRLSSDIPPLSLVWQEAVLPRHSKGPASGRRTGLVEEFGSSSFYTSYWPLQVSVKWSPPPWQMPMEEGKKTKLQNNLSRAAILPLLAQAGREWKWGRKGSPAGRNKPRMFVFIRSEITHPKHPPPHWEKSAGSCLRFVVFLLVWKPAPIKPVGLLAAELS